MRTKPDAAGQGRNRAPEQEQEGRKMRIITAKATAGRSRWIHLCQDGIRRGDPLTGPEEATAAPTRE